MWAGVTVKCIVVYISGLYTGLLSENVESSARSSLLFSFFLRSKCLSYLYLLQRPRGLKAMGNMESDSE